MQEMKELRREVNALKDAKLKSLSSFNLYVKKVRVTLTMNANGLIEGTELMSDRYAKIIAKAKDGKTMLGACTLDTWESDRNLDLRRIFSGSGKLGWGLIIINGNPSDWERVVVNGRAVGSVSVSYDLTIKTTSECIVDVTYEDNPYAPA